MYLTRMLCLILIIYSMQLLVVNAYPALLPYLHNPSNEIHTMKRNRVTFPIEDDVVELEELRNHNTERTAQSQKRSHELLSRDVAAETIPDAEETINHTNTLPYLEHQLELTAPLMTVDSAITTTPVIPKEEVEPLQVEPKSAVPAAAPTMGKAFYGAARLAFGQNPEILPTPSTSTTSATSISTVSNTTVAVTATAATSAATTTINAIDKATTQEQPKPIVSDIIGENKKSQETVEGDTAVSELSALTPQRTKVKQQLNKEIIGDILIDQLDAVKTTERRSSMQLSPKTAESLLRNPNGKYSSFDMAQYVFWTGDEAGVARAMEELIDENLISRENALKILRDIRFGIEFLQRSYVNRLFSEKLRQSYLKKNSPTTTTTTSTTSTTTTTTTQKPIPYLQLDQESQETQPDTSNLHLGKTFDSFTFWNKLRELDNEGRQDLSDYDDSAGRAKIVEYLYNEYTLEEILYKLAKVMFAQSLAHGSDEAQQELQKLTDFLEREGNLGVIPIDLQKKVLRVLLTALSDTLTEHPQLLPAARINLANPYYRLPMHTSSQ